jgi:signal transduction histidine kinase
MARVSTGRLRRRAAKDSPAHDYPALVKRMERLIEVSHRLASTLEQAKLLRQIVEAARELTDSDAASILLLDPTSDELRFEATTNMRAVDLKGIVVPREASIAGWIVSHSEPLSVADTRVEARWNPRVDEMTAFSTRSILGVPLIARDKTIGVLEALNKRDGPFSGDDSTTLQWLAAQAAVAIVNARLFQESDLVAEMVHELRTPLASLMAAENLLLRPELTDEQRHELVSTLQRETGRLAQLTTDFLDMARLESGRAHFTVERFDLAKLIAECLDVMRPRAAERRVGLTAEVPAGLPGVATDRDKLKQVMLNLLTNAVKYNQINGMVDVRVVDAGDHLRISVVDTGRGISPEVMARLFEKFYRAPDSERYADGTGLGLPIAKRIVEALGGEIGVQSSGEGGSTFYFDLPTGPIPTEARAN